MKGFVHPLIHRSVGHAPVEKCENAHLRYYRCVCVCVCVCFCVCVFVCAITAFACLRALAMTKICAEVFVVEVAPK